MKRLIKRAFNIGSTVRFKNHPFEKGIFTITKINEDGTVNIQDENGSYNNVDPEELTDSSNFIVGDKVVFKDDINKEIFVVKEVLPNNNYFIVNENNAFTNVNKRRLELVSE